MLGCLDISSYIIMLRGLAWLGLQRKVYIIYDIFRYNPSIICSSGPWDAL